MSLYVFVFSLSVIVFVVVLSVDADDLSSCKVPLPPTCCLAINKRFWFWNLHEHIYLYSSSSSAQISSPSPAYEHVWEPFRDTLLSMNKPSGDTTDVEISSFNLDGLSRQNMWAIVQVPPRHWPVNHRDLHRWVTSRTLIDSLWSV